MDLTAAILSLYPSAKWSLNGDDYENLWWSEENEEPIPTKDVLKKEITRLKREAKKKEYLSSRASEYPAVEDQLDMLWHMMDSGEIPGKHSLWYTIILDIKERHPKKS